MTKYKHKHMATILVIVGLIINLGYVITQSRILAEFIGLSIGLCGGEAAICYIIAKITSRKNPAEFWLQFGFSFFGLSLLVVFGNIYSKL